MNQPSIIAHLNAAWTADGYAHATPPTVGDIAAFESRYSVRLPPDFRLYIETVNGGALGRGSMDHQGIGFWRFDEIQSEAEKRRDDRMRFFGFADFLLDSHIYAIELHEDVTRPTAIVIDRGVTILRIADSFTGFVRGYLAGEGSVLFGQDSASGPSA